MSAQIQKVDAATRWRDKISQSNILHRLLEDFHNRLEVPLTPAQIGLGMRLIGKILPDLSAIALDVRVTGASLNKLELEARANILGVNVDNLWNDVNNQQVIEHQPIVQDDNEQPVSKLDSD